MLSSARRPVVEWEVWATHVRYARRRDEEALCALVARYRTYANLLARRCYRHGEPLEDLVQVAYEALLLALRRFEPERRTPFLAFARPTIIGAIQHHYRDAGWALRVPRRVHELVVPARDAYDLLAQDLGRGPSSAEIADFLGVDESEVLVARAAEDARNTSSLESRHSVTGVEVGDLLGAADHGFVGVENRMVLHQGLERLSAEDRELLRLYFVEERIQSDIADMFGCSQMQVSRRLRRVVGQLRRLVLDT